MLIAAIAGKTCQPIKIPVTNADVYRINSLVLGTIVRFRSRFLS